MIKKQSAIFIAILVVVIVVLAFVIFSGLQAEQGAVPGVNVGDEFIYDIRSFWSSDDVDVRRPENFAQLNMTEWYKIIVTEVSGPEVLIEVTWRFTNGTEFEDMRGSVNVETGIYSPTNGSWAIYGSNLRANDLQNNSSIKGTTKVAPINLNEIKKYTP